MEWRQRVERLEFRRNSAAERQGGAGALGAHYDWRVGGGRGYSFLGVFEMLVL